MLRIAIYYSDFFASNLIQNVHLLVWLLFYFMIEEKILVQTGLEN